MGRYPGNAPNAIVRTLTRRPLPPPGAEFVLDGADQVVSILLRLEDGMDWVMLQSLRDETGSPHRFPLSAPHLVPDALATCAPPTPARPRSPPFVQALSSHLLRRRR